MSSILLRRLLTAALLAGAPLALAACDNDGPAEQMGENVDEGTQEMGESLDDAGERVGEGLEETGDEIEDTAEGDR